MYLFSILLLMVAAPLLSICAESFIFHSSVPTMLLVGKWFVFWDGGIRLVAAGLRQFFQPRFTAEKIFAISSDARLPVIRELGIANFSIGTVSVLSRAEPTFVLPMAIVAAIFYGVAGARHLADQNKTQHQNIAMATDLLAALVLLAYVGSVLRLHQMAIAFG